jgi:hypothetical protein
MNALEKALTIKELHDLINNLENRALSFYEIASSKKRIHNIFALCDEAIFHKQLLAYKALTDPHAAAHAFAGSTPFSQSFRGYFSAEQALEDALYAAPESGWAFLHPPREGWQIWLIPAPGRTALISAWGSFEQCYAWLLEQQKHYACLRSNAALRERAAAENLAAAAPTLSPDPPKQRPEPALNCNAADAEAPDLRGAGSSATVCSGSAAPVPEFLQLKQWTAQLHALPQPEARQQRLYALELPGAPEISQHADMLLHCSELDSWQSRPAYIAEQVNLQGRFIKHLILLGAVDAMQAVRMARLFSSQFQHDIAALKEIGWEPLSACLTHADALFKCSNEQAEAVWQAEGYHPFIPAHFIHTRKFIQFAEQPASSGTPLLLLEERQKIRVIHGENRLALSRTEQAYPHLLLHRRHGLSWQMIQSIIAGLAQPVDVMELHEAIQQHISN